MTHRTMLYLRRFLAAAVIVLGLAAPASAQLRVRIDEGNFQPTPIAIPDFAVTGANSELAKQIVEVVRSDLASTGLFDLQNPASFIQKDQSINAEPRFADWKIIRTEGLVVGAFEELPDGKVAVSFRLWDIYGGELMRINGEPGRRLTTTPENWRRIAHKIADSIYTRLTGEDPYFDTRIVYIAETGPKTERVKRLAIMDSDGANHRFITNGQSIALTPRFSPDYGSILYVSYIQKRVRIFVYDIGTGRQRLITESTNPTFAPRWSPDGRNILFSMAIAGNTDIYRVSANGGVPVRLTNSPGIDVGGSYSPDGSKIVFESDRSGSQQIYVMNADGSGQRRISHGGGRYATPEWSPRGDLIAFTKIAGNFHVAVMTPDGRNERILTSGWQDEAPTWSPNGRVLQFFRTSPGRSGASQVWQVDLTGVNERRIPTPLSGSDPAWGPLLP